jgi:hypothetical protein
MANREEGNPSKNNAPRRIANAFQRFAGAVRERTRIRINNIRQRARTVLNQERTRNPEHEAGHIPPQDDVNEIPPASEELVNDSEFVSNSADIPAPEMSNSVEASLSTNDPFERMLQLGITNSYETGAGNQNLAHTSHYSLDDEADSLNSNSNSSRPASLGDISPTQSVVDAASATSNEDPTHDPLDDDISATQSLSDASSTDEGYPLRRIRVTEQVAEGRADRSARVAAWREVLTRQAELRAQAEMRARFDRWQVNQFEYDYDSDSSRAPSDYDYDSGSSLER